MSIVDTHANKEIKRIPVGNSPIQVAISKNGKKAYVTLAKDSAVAVVDVVEQHKIKAIAVKDAPAQIYADPLGRYMYVADQGSKEHPGDSISVIDVKSDTVIKTTNTGNMPHGVVAGLDGEFVYVTNMGEDTVAQIATKDFSVVNRYPVGKLPNGITLLEKN